MKISIPKKGLKVAWIADTHIPYQDPKAILLAQQIVADYKPDVMIFGGDLLDCVGISRFSNSPLDPVSNDFQRELDRFQTVFSGLVAAAGKADKYFTPGNHEDRLGKLLRDRAPALFGLDALQLPKLLELQKFNVSFLPRVSIGRIVFEHGDMVRKQSGGSVLAMMEAASYGYSLVIGHCHRMGLIYKSRPGQAPIFGMESGHLCDPAKLDYLNGNFMNWQLGLSLVTFKNGIAIPQPIPFYKKDGGWAAEI